MSTIRVQLQQFEGPLDLLLYLIRKEEMDIFNINIVEITKQYLDFIKLMKEFDLEVAGDFSRREGLASTPRRSFPLSRVRFHRVIP